jgi:hypothetical protein
VNIEHVPFAHKLVAISPLNFGLFRNRENFISSFSHAEHIGTMLNWAASNNLARLIGTMAHERGDAT